MLTPFEEDNIIEGMRDRVTEQFRNKEVFDKYLQLFANSRMKIQDMWKGLLQRRSIDESTGEQLDLIGRIVGQPRTLVNLIELQKFAFQGYPDGGSFGDLNDPSAGAEWYSLGDQSGSTVRLDDYTYRLFIKSKILKNRSASTPNQMVEFLSYLFGDIPIYITEDTAKFRLFFGRNLSSVERALLYYVSYDNGYPSRFIPKPIGVGVEYVYFNANQFFAFQGVPNAKGFGTTQDSTGWDFDWGEDYGGNPITGGYLASYIT